MIDNKDPDKVPELLIYCLKNRWTFVQIGDKFYEYNLRSKDIVNVDNSILESEKSEITGKNAWALGASIDNVGITTKSNLTNIINVEKFSSLNKLLDML